MDKDFIDIIGHEKEEFHPEKFNTDFNFVGNILARANELKFNFNRYKETSADQLFMSCLCYVANNISRSRAFNMDLYGSDYMPPEIKFRIYEKWQKDSSFEPPKTLSDAFVQVYSPSEVSAYVSNILKISKEEHSSLLTPHVTFDHDRQITGGRVLERAKVESTFSEDVVSLSLEMQEAHKAEIIEWLCSDTKEDLILDHDFGRKVGHGIDLNFCKYETQSARMIMQKDSQSDRKEIHILGCIGKTFFPDILKGEMTMERIPSRQLTKFDAAASHIKFPLYRTFALMKDCLYDNANVQLYYSEIGKLSMVMEMPEGKLTGTLSIFEDGLRLEFSDKSSRQEYTMQQLEMFDQIYKSNYSHFFKELERCYEQQEKIGNKWFDDVITEKELPEVTFDFQDPR